MTAASSADPATTEAAAAATVAEEDMFGPTTLGSTGAGITVVSTGGRGGYDRRYNGTASPARCTASTAR
jgi:hypothetical protein